MSHRLFDVDNLDEEEKATVLRWLLRRQEWWKFTEGFGKNFPTIYNKLTGWTRFTVTENTKE